MSRLPPFAEGFNLDAKRISITPKLFFSRAAKPNLDYPRWSRKRIEETPVGTADERLSQLRRFNRPGGDLPIARKAICSMSTSIRTEHQMGVTCLIQRNEKMKIGTQNQAFFPENILRNFVISKRWASMVLRLTASCWLTTSKKSSGDRNRSPPVTACGGYRGWIGDFIERRLNTAKADRAHSRSAGRSRASKASSFRPWARLPSAYRKKPRRVARTATAKW